MKKTYNNKQKRNIIPVEKTINTRGQIFPFALLSAVYILIHIFVSLNPSVDRGWGINFVRFFDPVIIGLFYAIMIAVCLPPVNKMVIDFFTSITRKKIINMARKYKIVLFILIAVGAGFVFHALQVKYVFLGDAGIRPTEVEEGKVNMKGEILTTFILAHLYTWLNSRWSVSGLQTIQIVSNISGSLFVLSSLLTANIIGKNIRQKIACFVIATLSLAALMQFCGYSETYSLDLFLLQLYLYLSVLHLLKKASIIFPIVALVIGIVAHFMLFFMLPSLAFMFYCSVLWKHSFFRKKNTLILLSILAIVVVSYVYVRIALPMMLPFSIGDKNIMTMFSTAHYKEFLNAQILGGGFVFIIWAGLLLFYLYNRKKVKFTVMHWFLCIASCSVTGFLFVVDLWRGSGDWDISSFGAITTNLTAAFLILDLHRQKIVKNIKYGICVISVFAVVHTSLWIVTNATDKSIGWVEKAFATDPAVYYKRSFSNESMLGAIFSTNDLKEKSLYWEKMAYLHHQNDPRTGYNYANVLIREGQVNEAVQIYESSVSRFPAYALPYAQLVNIYSQNKNYEALYRLLLKMESIYKKNPKAFTSRLSQEQINSYFDMLNQLKASAKP
ncbi:MAG: hypothetical protein LBS43_10190 [Prevotellaceae bacterium]|jgi:hypothetical protein|nr:hypothetical protein [Prevotellaceae bacterium]